MKTQLGRILIFVVLGAGLIFIMHKKGKIKKTERLIVPWNHVNKNSILGLTLSHPSHSYHIQKVQGDWEMSEPTRLPIREDRLSIMIKSLLSLNVEQIIDNPTKDELISYGLDTPGITVTLLNRNVPPIQSISIGNLDNTGSKYYVESSANKNIVYIITADILDPFLKGLPYIIDNQIFNDTIDNITSIALLNLTKENIRLEKEEDMWKQMSPEIQEGINWGVRKFLLKIKDLEFDSKSIIINPTQEDLKNKKIDVNKTPQLTLENRVTSKNISCFTDLESQYVYILPSRILALAKNPLIIKEIFSTRSQDLLSQQQKKIRC